MNNSVDILQRPIAADKADWLREVLIRPLRRADLSALEWEGSYIHFRRLYARAYRRARKGNAMLWLAELPGDKLLGQLFVLLRSDVDLGLADGKHQAFIHSFRVRPAYRSAGLGSRLLENAEQDLRRRGFRLVSLNVAVDNSRAIHFYERKGYRRMGWDEGHWSYTDHRGVKQQVHEPSWRMRKKLNGQ